MVEILEQLSVFNKFKFQEDIHKYFCNGVPLNSSVTRFIERFEVPFDVNYWSPKSAKKRGITTTEILAEWESKARVSQILGTAIHATIEFLSNNKIYVFNEDDIKNQCKSELEFSMILESYTNMRPIVEKYYLDSRENLIPIKLEMVVGDEELNLAGCVDGLFWNKKKKSLVIIDYKSNEKFKKENAYNKLLEPFSDLDQNSLNVYSIQLSTYKYIIEKNTNLKISDCWVVHFDRTQIKYAFYKCLDLSEKIKKYFLEN